MYACVYSDLDSQSSICALHLPPTFFLDHLMPDSGADGILPAYPKVKNLLQFNDQASQREEGGS